MRSFITTAGLIDVDHGTNIPDAYVAIDGEEIMACGRRSEATATASRALGMADRIGSIRKGKQADLLVVDGDPTTDMSALSRVRMVMQAGRVVYCAITPINQRSPAEHGAAAPSRGIPDIPGSAGDR